MNAPKCGTHTSLSLFFPLRAVNLESRVDNQRFSSKHVLKLSTGPEKENQHVDEGVIEYLLSSYQVKNK